MRTRQRRRAVRLAGRRTHMSIQPFSPMISMAFIVSPALTYISAAERSSLMFLAHSARFLSSVLRSEESSSPANSCRQPARRRARSDSPQHRKRVEWGAEPEKQHQSGGEVYDRPSQNL